MTRYSPTQSLPAPLDENHLSRKLPPRWVLSRVYRENSLIRKASGVVAALCLNSQDLRRSIHQLLPEFMWDKHRLRIDATLAGTLWEVDPPLYKSRFNCAACVRFYREVHEDVLRYLKHRNRQVPGRNWQPNCRTYLNKVLHSLRAWVDLSLQWSQSDRAFILLDMIWSTSWDLAHHVTYLPII